MNPQLKTVFGRIDRNVLYIDKQNPIILENNTIYKLEATYILIRIEIDGKIWAVDWFQKEIEEVNLSEKGEIERCNCLLLHHYFSYSHSFLPKWNDTYHI